jgi:hypothetical protein
MLGLVLLAGGDIAGVGVAEAGDDDPVDAGQVGEDGAAQARAGHRGDLEGDGGEREVADAQDLGGEDERRPGLRHHAADGQEDRLLGVAGLVLGTTVISGQLSPKMTPSSMKATATPSSAPAAIERPIAARQVCCGPAPFVYSASIATFSMSMKARRPSTGPRSSSVAPSKSSRARAYWRSPWMAALARSLHSGSGLPSQGRATVFFGSPTKTSLGETSPASPWAKAAMKGAGAV